MPPPLRPSASEAFAQGVGVSRSPIRKAFAVLEQLGAVRKERNRGYFLLKDAARISVSATLGVDPGEELYRRVVEDRLDGDLPPTIFASAEAHDQSFFLEAIQRQNRLRRLVEYRTNRQRSRLTAQCREHLKLLDLIEAGRRDEAAEFLRQHLDVVRNIKVTQGKKARDSRRAASEARP